MILNALEQIESKSRLMTKLIDELLDVTQLRAGEELQLDRRPIDLVALVQEEVAGQDETTSDHQLVVRTTEPEFTGWWDRLRLCRVVENLLSNAINYSPEGGEITVSVSRRDGPEGDYAVLSVQDRGIGIAENDLPHIFERFYRGKNAAGDIAGTGLGLAGVRQIIQQHGGAIMVESRKGEGSTFTVRLPIDPPPESAA
jgi:signal transduction histidine kinase